MRYYLDTSIWMDYYEDRKDPYTDLGENAFRLLCLIYASRDKIIVSNFLQRELERSYSLDKIRGMAIHFEDIIERVDISPGQLQEAGKIAEERDLPKGDVIHAIIARDNDAVMVARDKHFQLLKDICIVMKPEDII